MNLSSLEMLLYVPCQIPMPHATPMPHAPCRLAWTEQLRALTGDVTSKDKEQPGRASLPYRYRRLQPRSTPPVTLQDMRTCASSHSETSKLLINQAALRPSKGSTFNDHENTAPSIPAPATACTQASSCNMDPAAEGSYT